MDEETYAYWLANPIRAANVDQHSMNRIVIDRDPNKTALNAFYGYYSVDCTHQHRRRAHTQITI